MKVFKKGFCLLAMCLLLGGCAILTQGKGYFDGTQKVDWVKLTDGSITAVANLQKLGKVGIGLPCKFGVLDKDVCALYELADSAATPAIANARIVMDSYKANPDAGNEALLKMAYESLVSAWTTFNKANGKAEAAVPILTPAK
jgi:hypothetical protein